MTEVAHHIDDVCRSFQANDDRLNQIMTAAVRHLHAFAAEVQLTHDEWMAGIRFLTAVGRRCDDVRQEFILLSDTLGLSMLLERIQSTPGPEEGNHGSATEATESTVLGPFYVEGCAQVENGASIVADPDTGGEPLTVRGVVRGPDGGPVAGAAVEVWQVQPDGRYDVETEPGKRNLRARLRTDADGGFWFRTVRPVDYTIPVDGPVGEMLRATGRHPWRPAHIHFSISAPGHRPLVTHLFDAASPHLDGDTVFAVHPSLVRPMDGTCEAEFVLPTA
ncbi:MAG TPA: dioxygenase [Acidimicrobiales bacterium]|nr:dioxygenase [Acidimicrobiales bacterium]